MLVKDGEGEELWDLTSLIKLVLGEDLLATSVDDVSLPVDEVSSPIDFLAFLVPVSATTGVFLLDSVSVFLVSYQVTKDFLQLERLSLVVEQMGVLVVRLKSTLVKHLPSLVIDDVSIFVDKEALLVSGSFVSVLGRDCVLQKHIFDVSDDPVWHKVVALNTSWDWDFSILLQLSLGEDDLAIIIDDIALRVNKVAHIADLSALFVIEGLLAV